MFADYHVHCDHSPDCHVPMAEQLRRAAALGITDLCMTDHIELGLDEWGDEVIDLMAYRQEFEALRGQFPQLRLRFGVEVGISCPEHHWAQLLEMMQAMEYDFVIVSAHTLHGKNVLKALPYEGDGLARVCREYIPSILPRLTRLDPSLYSCVGHIDFPLKGALRCHAPCTEYRYNFAPEAMDALFRYIIDQGKCLELNTSPWGLMPPGQISRPDWLRRYAQLGGEYITIGSDSHLTQNTGAFFREAAALAREAGVKYLAVYEKMKPTFYPLSRI